MKYSHFIELMKQNYSPDKEKIFKDIVEQKKESKFKIVALILAIILFLGAAGVGTYYGFNTIKRGKDNHLPDELAGISPIVAVTPTEMKNDVIMPNSAFEITTDKVYSASDIYNMIEMSPNVPYRVKKTSGNTFTLTTNEKLSADTLYKISSKVGNKTAYSWAFQTETKFEITASSGGTKNCVSMFSTDEIWVEFSHSDVKDFEQYFSITPSVSGTFEQYGKRWVFIPSSDYSKNTVYTVTISKDIMSGDGQTLEKDYSFNVFSCVGNSFVDCINSSNDCDIFLSTEQPTATFEYMNTDVSHAKVTVYRTASSASFISIHNKYVKGGTVSSSISERFTNKPELSFDANLTIDTQKSRAMLTYPQPLETGFYISEVVFGDVVTYHLFEVSDYSIHTNVSNGIITLWLNDPTTQKPVSGIAIADERANISTTDANGVAQLNCQGKTDLVYLTISTPKPSAAIVKPKQSKAGYESYMNFSTIRTDRVAYKVGEVVKLWGFTEKSDPGAAVKYSVKCSWSDEETVIKPDENGTFVAELQTDFVASQNGYIDFVINGETVKTCYIDLYKSNPKHYVNITPDRGIYVEGQVVTYNAFVTLPDKTPVEGVKITLDGKEYVTNSRGIATITEFATAGDIRSVLRTFECDSQQYYVEYDVVKSNTYVSKASKADGILDIYVKSVDGTVTDTNIEVECYFSNTLQATLTATTVNQNAKIDLSEQDVSTHYVIKSANDTYTYYYTTPPKTESRFTILGKSEYNVGDKVKLMLVDNSTNTAVQNGTVLITLSYNNTVKNIVQSADSISFDFAKEFGDAVIVTTAYFDGSKLYKLADTTVNKKNPALDIVTAFDKPGYAPGETVNATVDVVGYDKKPVAATLCVNVYDSKVYIPKDNSYVKNPNNNYSPSLCFQTVKTDAAGHATFSFVLPDNVCSQTVDIIALDKNYNYGHFEKDIVVSAPIYIDTYVNDVIYDTDDVSFAFRFDGTNVGQNCNYTAVLFKDGIQIASKTGIAMAQQVKNETFGRVDTTGAQYTIKISLTSQNVSCESEKQFKFVKRSNAETKLTLQNRLHIDSENINSDVAINIYDPEYEIYFKIIDKMLNKTSNRVDHKLAYTLAKRIATANVTDLDDLRFISDYASTDGIFIYPGYSKANVPQAAIIATVAGDLFEKELIKTYFGNVFKSKPDTLNLIAANIVYASLGEPVLDDLEVLSQAIDSYSDEQKLFLALGFAEAGDYNRAYEISGGLLNKIKTANGTATFEADSTVATEYMSCIAAIVTSKLSHPKAKDLVKGVINSPETSLSGLAYCEFVTNCCIHIPGTNAVEFKDASEKKRNVHYKKANHVTFNVTKNELDKIKISNKSDENFICITTTESVNESYEKVKDVQTEITAQNTLVNDGGSVVVTATINTQNCKMGHAYAKFTLPHGLKFLNATVTDGIASVINDDEFYIYKSTDTVTVQFECYAAVEGKYTISAPTVIDRESKQIIEGNSIEITVQ